MSREELLAKKRAFIAEIYGKIPGTLDEIAEATIAVISRTNETVAGFAWDIAFGNRISNSHAAPVTGEKNWGGKDDLPSGYPGFQGRVWIRYYESPKGWCSDTFRPALSYPGTGGSGSYNGPWTDISTAYYNSPARLKNNIARPVMFSWDYRFFADDWPEATYEAQKDLVIARLTNSPVPKIKHSFVWTDPDLLAKDKEFIANNSHQVPA